MFLSKNFNKKLKILKNYLNSLFKNKRRKNKKNKFFKTETPKTQEKAKLNENL
jgi:hypothetical protein